MEQQDDAHSQKPTVALRSICNDKVFHLAVWLLLNWASWSKYAMLDNTVIMDCKAKATEAPMLTTSYTSQMCMDPGR
jgi:hypothetical protein